MKIPEGEDTLREKKIGKCIAKILRMFRVCKKKKGVKAKMSNNNNNENTHEAV